MFNNKLINIDVMEYLSKANHYSSIHALMSIAINQDKSWSQSDKEQFINFAKQQPTVQAQLDVYLAHLSR